MTVIQGKSFFSYPIVIMVDCIISNRDLFKNVIESFGSISIHVLIKIIAKTNPTKNN